MLFQDTFLFKKCFPVFHEDLSAWSYKCNSWCSYVRMCARKLNSEFPPQMVVTVVHEWVIKAECDFPLTGIMLAGPRSVASTAAETIKAYTVNLLCCPPLSLRFTVISHLYIFFFLDFTSCSTCCNGSAGGMVGCPLEKKSRMLSERRTTCSWRRAAFTHQTAALDDLSRKQSAESRAAALLLGS